MKFAQAVNAKDHAALIRLQRECLPYDIPYDKNGWYWLGFDRPCCFFAPYSAVDQKFSDRML